MNGAIQSGFRAAGEVVDALGIALTRDEQVATLKALKRKARAHARAYAAQPRKAEAEGKAAKKAAPKKAAPEKAAPKTAAPKKAAPENAAEKRRSKPKDK